MAFIHYIGGEGREGKLISVAVGLSANPESHIASLSGSMPFSLKLLGLELGSPERLEEIRKQFRALHIKGPWFRAASQLTSYVDALAEVERDRHKTKRVSLDLGPEEFAELEMMVGELGEKTKASVLRRARRFYRSLLRYKAQGYMIQAVKGGQMIQFPDLDDVRGPL